MPGPEENQPTADAPEDISSEDAKLEGELADDSVVADSQPAGNQPEPQQSQHNAIESEHSPSEENPGSEEAALEDGEDTSKDPDAEAEPVLSIQETEQGDDQPDEVQVSSEPDMLEPKPESPSDTLIEAVVETPKTQEDPVDDVKEHPEEDESTEQQSEAGNKDPQASSESPATVENEGIDPAADGNVETQSPDGNDDSETKHAIDGTTTEQNAPEDMQAQENLPPAAISVDENDNAAEPTMDGESVVVSHHEGEDSISETGASPVEDPAVIAEPRDVDDLVEESGTSAEHGSTAGDESNESQPITDKNQAAASEPLSQESSTLGTDPETEPAAGTDVSVGSEASIGLTSLPDDEFAPTSQSPEETHSMDEKPPEPTNVSNAVLEPEPTTQDELAVQGEVASDCAHVEDSEPNPLDVAIVERVLKAHSVASSVDDEGNIPVTATAMAEADQSATSNKENQQDTSVATTLVCDTDAGQDDAKGAPQTCEDPEVHVEGEAQSPKEAQLLETDLIAESNDTTDSAIATIAAVDTAESKTIVAEASSETSSEELAGDQGTEIANVEKNDGNSSPVATDISLDTSATRDTSTAVATLDPDQPGDSEGERQIFHDGPIDNETSDTTELDNICEVLNLKADETHGDGPNEQTDHPDEDSVGAEDLSLIAANSDPQSDDSAMPDDNQTNQDDRGDDGDGVEETTSTAISGSDDETLPTGNRTTSVVEEEAAEPVEAVVDSSHDPSADPHVVGQEEDSATVSDLQVPSDAPANDEPTEQASNASDSNDEPNDVHATPEVPTGGSVNDVVDEPAGGDIGRSHPQGSDTEAEAQPEKPDPGTPDDVSTEITNVQIDAIEGQSPTDSSEHLVDPVTTDEDTTSQEPLVEDSTDTANSDIESPVSIEPSADASAACIVDESISRSPMPDAEEQESEPSGIEPSPPNEVNEAMTVESQAATDPHPTEAAAQSVETPVLEDAVVEEVPVLKPQEDLVVEPVSQDAMPGPPAQPDAEEVNSESFPAPDVIEEREVVLNQESSQELDEASIAGDAEPLAKIDVTPEQECPSPDAIVEPAQSEADAAATDNTVASEAVAESADGVDAQEGPSSGKEDEQNEGNTEQPETNDAQDASTQAEQPATEQPELNNQESSPVAEEPTGNKSHDCADDQDAPPVGEEVNVEPIVPDDTAQELPQETAAPPPEETSAPPPEETSAPPPEETSAPPPEETSAPPPEETSASPPEETSAPPPEETTAPPPEETTAKPAVDDTCSVDKAVPVHTNQQEVADGEAVVSASNEAKAAESGDQPQEATQKESEDAPHAPLDEEMDEVQPTTPPVELEETSMEVPTEDAGISPDQKNAGEPSTRNIDLGSSGTTEEGAGGATEQAQEPDPSQKIDSEPAPELEPSKESTTVAAEVPEIGEEAPVEPSQDPVTQPVTEEPPQVAFVEESAQTHEPLEQDRGVDMPESSREAVPPAIEESLDPTGLPEDKQPRTPPNESALVDEPTPDTTPRDKHRRRHSHAHRDSRHSHRRRESNASASERPTLNPMALLAAAKLAGSAKSKRRDSLTDREYGRHKERLRETEKASSSSKERSHREHRSHRHHRDSRDDKESKRRTVEEVEADAERRQRREARRAEKERIAQEDAVREAAEEEERRRKHREERHARRAEQERLRKEEEGRLAREAGEKHAREEEERRMRHEKRRLKYEADKEAKRLEREKANHTEEERRLRRKGKLATKGAEIDPIEPRDAARRAAEEEEEDESVPEPPITPREPTRRHTGDRRRDAPPPPRRNSILGGLFGRSKTDPVVPSAKSIKPMARVRTDPAEAPPSPVEALRKEKEGRASSQHSSNESRERGERPHRSRRHSHAHRRFNSAEEEAEYRARKEERRRAKEQELEMSGARDGGVSLSATVDDAPPPEPPEPAAALESQRNMEDGPPSPLVDDAAAVVGVASTSSNERRERRRATRHVSILEQEHERPKSRRISVTDRERPASRRTESDRPRTRGAGEERARPRRSETERSRSSKKKEDNSIKGFFGGLKRIVA
ncbi:hypothetical protein DPSP01_004223 [Paraphaeosphaeria sporulosa]